MRLTIIALLFVVFGGCKEKQKIAYFSNGEPIPKSVGWVNDFDNVFSKNEEIKLNEHLSNFEKQTTYEVVVVTLDTFIVGNMNDDMFTTTLELASAWGVGKADKNNGVLIGICIGRRKIYIQNGKGTAKVLSNEQTKKFIDSVFTPYYRKAEYFKGTFEGVKAITSFLENKKIPAN